MHRWSIKVTLCFTSVTSFSVLIFLCLSANGFSQETNTLQNKLDRLLLSSEFKYASVSITVVDFESSEHLAEVNPDMSIIPASSLKLLTTLSAVELLSDTFQFVTRITHDGYIEQDGTLKGNIYIEGTGDPTFGSGEFKTEMDFTKLFPRIAQAIANKGITCVDGLIIADESEFNAFPISPSWQWNDLGNYYASGAWGININENEYTIVFKDRGAIGRRPKISYHYPSIPQLEFSNEVVVDSSHTGDQAYIFGGPYNYKKRIVGTIPQGTKTFSIKGSIPDPPLYAAYFLSKKLEDLKIKSNGYETEYYPTAKSKRKLITRIKSPYLRDIARTANFDSNNLYCEAILKAMGKDKNGEATGQNGIAAIRGMLRKFKIDHKALNMEDGSGLSARNNISSHLLADFLQQFAKKKGIDYTIDFLPKAGSQGTVRGVLRNSAAQGHVWMKSGSMNRVLTYTGILEDSNGNWKTFSIMINGFDVDYKVMRSKVEKMVGWIYRY